MASNVRCKILNVSAVARFGLPEYASSSASGVDLRACIERPVKLAPGDCKLIPTGLALFIEDPRWMGLLVPRSGLGHKNGIILGNSVGVIDADYQGEIKVSLWNRGGASYCVDVGERIAQLLLVAIGRMNIQVVEEFPSTNRGEGGFGSTGKG